MSDNLNKNFTVIEGSKKINRPPRLSNQQITEILDMAKWAPSGDNCQAFRFVWSYGILKIYRNADLDRHAFNNSGLATQLNLGALVEYIAIAALKKGFKTHCDYADSVNTKGAIAKIHFTHTGLKDSPYYNTLKLRATDRRVFQKGSLKVIQNMISEFQQENLQVNAIDAHQAAIVKLFSKTEQTLLIWKTATLDLLRWLRLSKKEVQDSSDGLPFFNLGIKAMDVIMLKLMRRFPQLHAFMSFFAKFQYKKEMTKALKSSAAVVSFSTDSLEMDSIVEMGRVATRAWLKFNQNGFGVHPLSQSSLLVSEIHNSGAPESVSKALAKTLTLAWNPLLKLFSLNPEKTKLVWTFRVGQSESLPQELRTKRKETKQILSFEK